MDREAQKTPKYFRISREIVRAIQQGKLGAGAQIPSENEIIEKYQVSNTTARKALLELEHSGWVTRIRGKGTYVRHQKIERSATRILAFTKNMREAGCEPSTELVSLHLLEPSCSVTLHDRTYTLAGPLCKIVRLRLGDGVPMMLETRYISSQLCPGLHKFDLEGSLYDLYENEYSLHLTEIRQTLSAVILEGERLTSFGLDQPIPAFRVDGVTFCGKEMILEMEESVYRGDIYQFTVNATG